MPTLKIHLFGPPRFAKNGSPLDLPRRKSAALLAYLAVTRQPHSRDALAALLWPDFDQSSARANLRRELSRLKSTLDDDILSVERETVSLQPQADVWVDAAAFQSQIDAAQVHDHPQNSLCAACADSLTMAVDLYQDGFMAGFSLPDSPAFDEWQFFQADSLRRALGWALEQLSGWHASRGEYEPGIALCRRWSSLDPLHEPAQRQLMRLYAWAGQQAAALRQYAECVRQLEQELGVEPEEETQALYEAIKTRRLEEPARLEAEAERAPPEVNNLPADLSPFIGRQRELSVLGELLSREETRLVTIVGLGGSGKTRLAVAAARQALQERSSLFLHGAVYIPLAGVESSAALPLNIARALGLSLAGQVAPLIEICNHLQNKRLLLVLDNFEQLLEGASLLNQLLAAVPGLKLLVTSREPLHLEAEWRLDLQGLAFPSEPLPGDGDRYDAVRLFVQTGQQVQPDFQLTAERRPHVYRLCRLVAGIPLAIKLAASWLRVMSCQQICAEVARSIDILTSRQRDVPSRQRSMRAVFESTWEQLAPQEQQAFAALAVFRGGFTEQAAYQVAQITPFLLAGLEDRGLVQFAGNERYEIHELTRQFASQKSQATLGDSSAASRHSAYYLDLVARQSTCLYGEDPNQALNALRGEIDNIRQAWRWAVNQGHFSRLAEATSSLAAFLEFSGLFSEGERLFQAALQKLESLPPPTQTTEGLGAMLGEYLSFLMHQAKWNEVQVHFERLAALAQDSGETLQIAQLHYLSGLKHQYMGEFAQAIDDLRQAALLFQELNQPRRMAIVFNYLGEALSHSGKPDQALSCHQQAFEIGEALGDSRLKALSLSHIGVANYYKDEYQEAITHWESALAYFERLDYPLGIGRTLNNLGYIYNRSGERSRALRCARKATTLLHQIGDRSSEANAYDTLGEIYYASGDFSQARQYYMQAIQYTQELNLFRLEEAMYRANLGLLEIAVGNYEEAQQHLAQAFSVVSKEGHPKEIAKTLAALASLDQHTGRGEQAIAHYNQAIQCLEKANEQNELSHVLVQKAGALFAAGAIAEAEKCARQSLAIAQAKGNKPAAFQARLLIAELAYAQGRIARSKELLHDLLAASNTDSERAAVYYALWEMSKKAEHASRALALYHSLSERSFDITYQERMEHLQAALQTDPGLPRSAARPRLVKS